MNDREAGQLHKKIHQLLLAAFDEGALRILCSYLGVHYDDLPVMGRANKANELVSLMRDKGRLSDLKEEVTKMRPNIAWPEVVEYHAAADQLSVFGDVNVRPITSQAALRHQFDFLIQEYMALFAGRQKALEDITAWIRQTTSGYLVITAPAGFGKTALMIALVQAEPAAFAYHFFHQARVPHSLDQLAFLRNTVEQMAQWHGREMETLPERLDQLVALYNQYMSQESDYARLLVLDGIDEITAWPVKNFLPRRLANGLRVIVTLRDVGQDWLAIYNLPHEQTDHLALGGLDRDAVIQVLHGAGPAAAGLAGDEAALDQFLRVAAYPARRSLGADPFYVRLLAEDLAASKLKPEQLGDLSPGLNRYLDEWWKQIRALAIDEAAADLFGTLTVARGAIGRGDLEAVNPSLVDEDAGIYFDEVIDRVRRFVAGDDEVGYTLAHPRLKSHLLYRRRNLPKYEERLLAYGQQWAEHDPPSAYTLAYLAQHLADAGRTEDLFALLSPDWMTAKYACFHSHRSFAEDLALIAGHAAKGGPDYLPPLVRACLVHNELSVEAPPEILAVLAQIGQGRRAMDYAALMPDVFDQRNEAYRLIGRALLARGETALAATAFEAAGLTLAAGRKMPPLFDDDALQVAMSSWPRLIDLPAIHQARAITTDPAVQLLLAAVINILEEVERSSLPLGHPDHQAVPVTLFEDFQASLKVAIDWAFPTDKALILHDVAGILVRAGWSDRVEQIAGLAHDDAVCAWVAAQLAIGLARAGDNDAAARVAGEIRQLDEEGVLDGAADAAEEHWLARPARTAVAQALALAGDDEQAAEAVNRVLTTTRTAGFEADKTGALIAIARALRDTGRIDQALEAARLAAATAVTILDPWDQADVCEQLLPLLHDLSEDEIATRIAELIFQVADSLGQERLIANLVTAAQVLAATYDPAELAGQIRYYAEYEPLMHEEEVAAVVAPVAHRLAELGAAGTAVALAVELLDLWPYNAGELLAGIAAALARGGHPAAAGEIVQNTMRNLDPDDPARQEENVFLLESLALGLAGAGLDTLARQAAGAIPWVEERDAALAGLEEVEPTHLSGSDEGDIQESGEESPVTHRPLAPDEATAFVAQFNQRLMAGGLPDRSTIYLLLEEAAGDLAAIDQGQSVWLLFESIKVVDRWWDQV